MEVERVDQVELGQVRDVDAHRLRAADLDRVAGVVERRAVDCVEVVLAVAVRVEGVHDHDELLRGRARLGRVDDERAVEALVDVLLQRRGVAVVEVHPVRPRRELVREAAARVHDLEDAVHVGRVDAVEVDRVRVRAGVAKVDAEQVVLGHADHRAGHRAVVRPRGIDDALGDLDLPILREQRVLADAARLVRQGRGRVGEGVEVVRARPGPGPPRRSSPRGPAAWCRCPGASPRASRPPASAMPANGAAATTGAAPTISCRRLTPRDLDTSKS